MVRRRLSVCKLLTNVRGTVRYWKDEVVNISPLSHAPVAL